MENIDMGIFYLYTDIKPENLEEVIGFQKPKIKWKENKQYIYCDCVEYDNLYNHIACVEYFPNHVNIYYGIGFFCCKKFNWDDGMQWLAEKGYSKCTNYILMECFPSMWDVIEGISLFQATVAHNKAEKYLLQGGSCDEG